MRKTGMTEIRPKKEDDAAGAQYLMIAPRPAYHVLQDQSKQSATATVLFPLFETTTVMPAGLARLIHFVEMANASAPAPLFSSARGTGRARVAQAH
jgi:hypothetical protein